MSGKNCEEVIVGADISVQIEPDSPEEKVVPDPVVENEPVMCLDPGRGRVRPEARHSIGGGTVKERLASTSAGLGLGGVRSSHLAKSHSEIQVCVSNSLSVSQNSRNSRNSLTYSSSGTFYDHSRKKSDIKIPPKPKPAIPKVETDFRQMEKGLLQLLDDFHSGKLEGFGDGQNCTFDKMENVREQQEKLARLHFDLNAQQELCGHTKRDSDEGIKMARGNLAKLMENLQELSLSIEQLQAGNQVDELEKDKT